MIQQLFLAAFGVAAVWLAMDPSPRRQWWAPFVGLAGQPFWAWFAWDTKASGLGVAVLAFTLAYIRGAIVNWRKPRLAMPAPALRMPPLPMPPGALMTREQERAAAEGACLRCMAFTVRDVEAPPFENHKWRQCCTCKALFLVPTRGPKCN